MAFSFYRLTQEKALCFFFFFSSRRRHTRCYRDWSSDVCSSDLVGGSSGARTDLLRQGRRDAAEIAGEKPRELMALRVVQHPEQHAELDAVRMGLDLARGRRELLDRPVEPLRFAFHGLKGELHM